FRALSSGTPPETPPPMPKACLRHDEGGGRCVRGLDGDRRARKIARPPSKSLDASGGGDRLRAPTATPTRNAIGLSRPTAYVALVADGRLSPWRSVLPPRGGGVAREPSAEAKRSYGA